VPLLVNAELKGDGASDLLRKEGVVVVVAAIAGNFNNYTVDGDFGMISFNGGGGPGSEWSKVGEAASIEGEGVDAALIHDRAKRGFGGIDQRCDGTHGDGGFDPAHRKLRVNDCAGAWSTR
jgi:hypothetical protein